MSEYVPSPAVVAVMANGPPAHWLWRVTTAPPSGSSLCASVTVPARPPHGSGSSTVRVTSTVTWRGLGAVVTKTTDPRYSPGARLGSPIVIATSVLPST